MFSCLLVFPGPKQESFWSRAKKAHKHKETHPTSPISDPTLKFFMWGSPLLENKGEGASHIKNLGLHWGPLDSLCGYFFMCFFRFLFGVCKKVPENTRKSQKIHQKGQFWYFWLFRVFSGTFFADPQKDSFWDFLALFCPEGPETPVNGRWGRKGRRSQFFL